MRPCETNTGIIIETPQEADMMVPALRDAYRRHAPSTEAQIRLLEMEELRETGSLFAVNEDEARTIEVALRLKAAQERTLYTVYAGYIACPPAAGDLTQAKISVPTKSGRQLLRTARQVYENIQYSERLVSRQYVSERVEHGS